MGSGSGFGITESRNIGDGIAEAGRHIGNGIAEGLSTIAASIDRLVDKMSEEG